MVVEGEEEEEEEEEEGEGEEGEGEEGEGKEEEEGEGEREEEEEEEEGEKGEGEEEEEKEEEEVNSMHDIVSISCPISCSVLLSSPSLVKKMKMRRGRGWTLLSGRRSRWHWEQLLLGLVMK